MDAGRFVSQFIKAKLSIEERATARLPHLSCTVKDIPSSDPPSHQTPVHAQSKLLVACMDVHWIEKASFALLRTLITQC